ncbi:MAG: carotenoid 1,2-hydratase [Pseudomonadota bacterium]
MTERGARHTRLSAARLAVGPSALTWDGRGLTIDVHERCAPLPYPLRGQIKVHFNHVLDHAFTLEDAGAHRWAPVQTNADVEVAFTAPALSWRGTGYVDSNQGAEPLEAGFRHWDWSRYDLGGGETAVLYNTAPRQGAGRSLAVRFTRSGEAHPFDLPPEAALPATRIWRIARPTRSAPGAPPRHLRTFEDTPFYARSLVEANLLGARRVGVYESFSGDRLRHQIVKAMLPFRMPRWA